jgi:asparaginyl-tRNA synthetase
MKILANLQSRPRVHIDTRATSAASERRLLTTVTSSMADPVPAYLEKHSITGMLNGIVEDLVKEQPADPITFLINGLLKESTKRGQETALLQRLNELKTTLLKDQQEVKGLAAEKKALEEEISKLQYRVTHLCLTIDEMEAGGATSGGSSAKASGGGGVGVTVSESGVKLPASLIGVPPGHTPFSWAGGVAVGGAPSAGSSAGTGTSAKGASAPSSGLPKERFSDRVAVATLLKASGAAEGTRVVVMGWVKTNRTQKKLCFMSINDGSCASHLQLVVTKDEVPEAMWEAATGAGNGASVRVEGCLKASPKEGQKWELPVESIEVLGPSDGAKYPIPPVKINLETLRAITHMRPRTGVMGAVMRIRNSLAYATHNFFQQSGFMYVHAPLITGADCEGAGEMFQVTTLDLAKPLPKLGNDVDYTKDFFGKPAFLTVSGQLNGEYYACAFGSIYTFGPTFRAENSNTTRHLAEFWMIEPEIAFCDLPKNMDCAESYLRHCFRHVLENNADDLAFLEEFEINRKADEGIVDTEAKLRERLEVVVKNDFGRLPYTEAIEIVSKVAGPREGVPWEFPPVWGQELQTEHEKYLAEVVYKKPVIVYNYPKGCKAFYMRMNEGCAPGKETVAAMDVLFPRVGEMVGGSQREERLDILLAKMAEMGLKEEDYSGYLDTRRFGSQPHAGFGVGFERLVLYATGMGNIRDAIPFPRTVGQMIH